MLSLGSHLQLRCAKIRRNKLIEFLERESGQRFLYEYRYFLDGQPLHDGMAVQLCRNQKWLPGRFEWTGNCFELPRLRIGGRLILIFEQDLLRWPPK